MQEKQRPLHLGSLTGWHSVAHAGALSVSIHTVLTGLGPLTCSSGAHPAWQVAVRATGRAGPHAQGLALDQGQRKQP